MYGISVFICNTVVNYKRKLFIINARGEVISVAEHSDGFTFSSLRVINLPLIFAPFMEMIRTDQSQYTIIDTFNI